MGKAPRCTEGLLRNQERLTIWVTLNDRFLLRMLQWRMCLGAIMLTSRFTLAKDPNLAVYWRQITFEHTAPSLLLFCYHVLYHHCYLLLLFLINEVLVFGSTCIRRFWVRTFPPQTVVIYLKNWEKHFIEKWKSCNLQYLLIKIVILYYWPRIFFILANFFSIF